MCSGLCSQSNYSLISNRRIQIPFSVKIVGEDLMKTNVYVFDCDEWGILVVSISADNPLLMALIHRQYRTWKHNTN